MLLRKEWPERAESEKGRKRGALMIRKSSDLEHIAQLETIACESRKFRAAQGRAHSSASSGRPARGDRESVMSVPLSMHAQGGNRTSQLATGAQRVTTTLCVSENHREASPLHFRFRVLQRRHSENIWL